MYRIRPHWSLHPEKRKGLYVDADGKLRSEWYDHEIKSKKMTQSAVARELDINYELSVEGVIFKQFGEMHILRGEYQVNPDLPVIRIVDYGGCCAASFAQKTNFGQMLFFKEIVILQDGNANKLGQAIQSYSHDLQCNGFRDYDDPAGVNDKWVNGTSSAQTIRMYGVNPTHTASGASPQRRKDRLEHIHFHLANLTEDGPAVMIHESMKWTIEAFQSGYRHPENPDGTIDVDDVDEMHPYEDVMDNVGMGLMEELGIRRPGERRVVRQKSVTRDKYTGRIIR